MEPKEPRDEEERQEALPETDPVETEPATPSEDAAGAAKKELLYLRAEFENYKRRILREQEQAIRFANEKLVGEISGVADLLDRALASSKPLVDKNPDAELKGFIVGVELTQKELGNVLAKFGVEFFGAPGEKFDPARHEAISQTEVSDDKAGLVSAVHQKGCSLQGRVLKPARVSVGVAAA